MPLPSNGDYGASPAVRFDDLRSNPARSFRLDAFRGAIEAHDPPGVLRALRDVAEAVQGGLWAGGFVAYEAAPAFDPVYAVRARPPEDPFEELPLVWFGLFERAEDSPLPEAASAYALTTWTPTVERARYEADVGRIRELIAAGETYQVNHTFRLRSGFEGDPVALYRDLCLAQRGGHCAFVDTGRLRVLSASPELYFEVEGDVVTSRPMKGTARRGRWAEEDRAGAAALVASAKDRAENAMIVDLVRSDMGRIAVSGSVEAGRRFEAERYETVWQLTSTVTARLPDGAGPVEVFEALFPCGSVTGAPKVRTMRAIAELEDSPRGVYTGAVGWLAPPGTVGPSARFNVAIRTVVIDPRTGRAEYGVGGGITWDSSPAGEYDECRAKALVLTTRRPAFELIETLLFEAGRGYPLLQRHLERLAGSAEYFGFAYDEGAIRQALGAAVRGRDGAHRVRLLLAREGNAAVEVVPVDPAPDGPVRLALHLAERVDPTDPFLFHKTTRRDRYERAAAAHPPADDVVLVNDRDEVTETTIANLVARFDGRWWTPPLDAGCLPGTMRAELLATGQIAERILTVDEVLRADGLALISGVRGWRAAELLPD